MNKNKALTALLAENPKVCKALHEMSNLDWQQPISVTEYTGKFTHNSICKEIKNLTEAAHKDCNVFLLYKNPADNFSWKRERLFIVEVDPYEFCILKEDIRGYNGISYKYEIETEYKKGDFEEARKSGKLHYWLIIQERSKESHRQPVYDRTARFVVKDFSTYIRQEAKGEFISRFEVKPLDRNYPTITVAPNGRSQFLRIHIPTSERYTIVDKSGYIVSDQRSEYQRKVNAIKTEKAAAEAARWDNAEAVKKFEDRIEVIHEQIINEFARTVINYRKIRETVWNIELCESSLKALKEKSFTSMNRINYAIADVDKYLTKAENAMKE